MKNFEIVYYPSENDLKQMLELDCESFSELDRGELGKCLEWKSNCPEMYTAIKLDGKIIGYINFVAITKESYNKIKTGNLKDYELSGCDVLPFKKGINYCLFMSMVVKEKFRYTEVIVRLLNAFFEKINKMKQSNVVFGNVLCDCVSKDGENFVKKNPNAKFVCNSKNGTKIYELKL